MHRASILLLPPVSTEPLAVSFFEDILPKLCRFFLGILGYVPLAFAGRSKPYLRFKTPRTRQKRAGRPSSITYVRSTNHQLHFIWLAQAKQKMQRAREMNDISLNIRLSFVPGQHVELEPQVNLRAKRGVDMRPEKRKQ